MRHALGLALLEAAQFSEGLKAFFHYSTEFLNLNGVITWALAPLTREGSQKDP